MNVGLLVGVLRARADLRSHDRWTRDELLAHQAQAMHELRAYAVANSPFYRGPPRARGRATRGPTDRHQADAHGAVRRPRHRPGRAPRERRGLSRARLGDRPLPGALSGGRDRWHDGSSRRVPLGPGRVAHRPRLVRTGVRLGRRRRGPDQPAADGGRLVAKPEPPIGHRRRHGRIAVHPDASARRDAADRGDRGRTQRIRPDALVGYASMLRILADEQTAGGCRSSRESS